MCTSCAYCLPECPEGINIPAYMEVYNHYLLTGDLESTRERLKWHHTFGLLKESEVSRRGLYKPAAHAKQNAPSIWI